MYIKDGSNLEYNSRTESEHTYSWGWLGDEVESSGWDSEDLKKQVIEKLSDLGYDNTVAHTRGIHICGICSKDGKSQGMGNSTIKISYNGKIYSAPSDVVHYIEAHDYKPDDVVIEAILNGRYLSEEDLDIGWEFHMTDEEMDNRLKDNLEKILLMGMRGEIDKGE